MKTRWNVVILGKSGVGKSSLINYLLGSRVAETGIGRPVTRAGLHRYDLSLNSRPCTLFDSWGIEANKTKEWEDIIEAELKRRGKGSAMEDWYHTIIYCISAGGGRVEEFESDLIRKFTDRNYKVIVALTKMDQADPKDLNELCNAIKKCTSDNTTIVRVCSEEKTLLNGERTVPTGRDALIHQILDGLWQNLRQRIPDECEQLLIAELDSWASELKEHIKRNPSRWNFDERKNQIDKCKGEFIEKLSHRLPAQIVQLKVTEAMNLINGVSHIIGFGEDLFNTRSILNSDKTEDSNFNYLHLIFLPVAIPAAIVYGAVKGIRHLIVGDEDNEKDLITIIDDIYQNLKKQIISTTPKIADYLNAIPVRALTPDGTESRAEQQISWRGQINSRG